MQDFILNYRARALAHSSKIDTSQIVSRLISLVAFIVYAISRALARLPKSSMLYQLGQTFINGWTVGQQLA